MILGYKGEGFRCSMFWLGFRDDLIKMGKGNRFAFFLFE
ncbi:conserved hypothetical protein [delta proteobacterium NaphS2]|nr:conserved hypothetical protein [delta proteobacterium NaphS2]